MNQNKQVFSLQNYQCIGFDLDHTLCRYRIQSLFDMEYRVLAEYLIREKNYCPEMFKSPFENGQDFLLKGLVLDIHRGNLLKLSRDGSVLRAFHGTRLLSEEEWMTIYGMGRGNELLREFIRDFIGKCTGTITRKLRPFNDYFDLPAALMSANIVDFLDKQNDHQPLDKYRFWMDLLYGLVDMFKRENLKSNTGGYYPAIRANPELYLKKRGDQFKTWLSSLHQQHSTFLISGSDPEYVDLVASYCLGGNWKSYFNFIVCGAKKPNFFMERHPFHEWDSNGHQTEELAAKRLLEPSRVYVKGNWQQLYRSLNESCGSDQAKCLYIGDHVIQDVLAARRFADIDVVAVVEEMAAEGLIDPLPQDEHEDADCLKSVTWGSYFSVSDQATSNASPIETLWASIIKENSILCIPDVEFLARLPMDSCFQPDAYFR